MSTPNIDFVATCTSIHLRLSKSIKFHQIIESYILIGFSYIDRMIHFLKHNIITLFIANMTSFILRSH
uniref:Uncharacterized protein n=1 Tax=Rhizophora mucronata TaxID=61149 RepID=A0A2P2MWI6_RHIMU